MCGTGQVTWSLWASISPFVKKNNNNTYLIVSLWRLNEIIGVKYSESYLAHTKFYLLDIITCTITDPQTTVCVSISALCHVFQTSGFHQCGDLKQQMSHHGSIFISIYFINLGQYLTLIILSHDIQNNNVIPCFKIWKFYWAFWPSF